MSWKRKLVWLIGAIVLLLLVAVPIATVRIRIDLPPAADTNPSTPAKPVVIAVAENGPLRVDGSPSSLYDLTGDIATRTPASDRSQQRVVVHAPEGLPPERLIVVLERLKKAGWSKIGLVYDAKAAT